MGDCLWIFFSHSAFTIPHFCKLIPHVTRSCRRLHPSSTLAAPSSLRRFPSAHPTARVSRPYPRARRFVDGSKAAHFVRTPPAAFPHVGKECEQSGRSP